MARAIIGIIVGYVVMFILNFLGFVTLYAVIGPDQAFEPGLYLASNKWIAISFVIIFITGTIAGLVCAAIAKGGKAPLVLAIVALAIGITLGALHIATQPADTHELRTASVPNMEAMTKARHPVWVVFAGPVIAAIGIGIGGKLRRRS